MGLDISVSMVCGVKASDIFPQGYRKESRQIQTVDALGEQTGQTKTLKEYFLDCPNGNFFVGSNKKALTSSYGGDRIEVTLSKIFGSENEYDSENEWIHSSDPETYLLEQYVIGLEIDSTKYVLPASQNTYNLQVPTTIPEDLVSRVQEELSTRFGYQGEIHAIAVVDYSY